VTWISKHLSVLLQHSARREFSLGRHSRYSQHVSVLLQHSAGPQPNKCCVSAINPVRSGYPQPEVDTAQTLRDRVLHRRVTNHSHHLPCPFMPMQRPYSRDFQPNCSKTGLPRQQPPDVLAPLRESPNAAWKSSSSLLLLRSACADAAVPPRPTRPLICEWHRTDIKWPWPLRRVPDARRDRSSP